MSRAALEKLYGDRLISVDKNSEPFKFVSIKKTDDVGVFAVVYQASFRESHYDCYVRLRCHDTYFKDRDRLLNTSPSVSYYSDLMKHVRRGK